MYAHKKDNLMLEISGIMAVLKLFLCFSDFLQCAHIPFYLNSLLI